MKMIDLVEYPDYIDRAFLNHLAGVRKVQNILLFIDNDFNRLL